MLPVDPPTLFLVLVVLTLSSALLLFGSWLQNRQDRTLLWFGLAYALCAVGNVLFIGRGRIHDFVSIDIATALILYGFSLAWVGARVFNGKPPQLWPPLVGVVIWLLFCRVPVLHDTFGYRVMVISAITALAAFATAHEFWGHDGLRGRHALALAFAIHGAIVALRIPVAISELNRVDVAFNTPWFGLMALEAIIFTQVASFLSVALTKQRVEWQLREMALRDPLTGLANRRAVFEHGTAILGRRAPQPSPIAVLTFDLDRFKQINDRHGHPVGDRVIRAFAQAALTELGPEDHVGRIGGEEFAVIMEHADEATACAAADRVMLAFRQAAFAVDGIAMNCTTSVGIAVSPDRRHSIQHLLSIADGALYEAKRAGGNCVRVAAAGGPTAAKGASVAA